MTKIKKLILTTDKTKENKIVSGIDNLKADLVLRSELWQKLSSKLLKTRIYRMGQSLMLVTLRNLGQRLKSWLVRH